MYEHIPNELKQLNQWCVYRLDDSGKKLKKLPIDPHTGGYGKSNDESTWSDYETALNAINKYNCHGLGFYFKAPYYGVDIDNIEGEIERYKMGDIETNMAYEFIETLQSYAEYSVSGTGLHIICRGKLPEGSRRKGDVEMYDSGRFFVMTGNVASQYKEVIEPKESSIKRLYRKYLGTQKVIQLPTEQKESSVDLSESEIIAAVFKSKQAKAFEMFMTGGWEAIYTSQSEADLAFCNMLAFWTGRDFSKMDALFRQSSLMRGKWDEKRKQSTYGADLLNKAIHECPNIYTPKAQDSGFRIYVNQGEDDKPKEKKFYSYDDTGNADRFIDIYGTMIRYSFINKVFYYYDGKVWKADQTGEVRKMIDSILEVMKNEEIDTSGASDEEAKEKIIDAFRKHLKRSRSNSAKKALTEELMHRSSVLPDEFDINKTLLNVQNGYVDLSNGELEEHNIKHMFTRISDVEFTDKIDCPRWIEFLDEIFNNDQELIRYIQKAIGYSLTGSTREQCLFILFGNGRNGKSIFLDTISEIMGSYAANMQAQSIMVKQSTGGANTDIARLQGARLVTSSEPNEGVRLDEGLVKQLTGGDKVTARFLYGKEFEFQPEFKLWLATNHKPIIRGTDDGIWRRINMIPFTVQIPDHKVDKNLKYKLQREWVGILNWMVEGCLLWQREGLKRPESVEQASKEYREEMDVTTAFSNECCDVGIGLEVKAKDLYDVYKRWATENGQYVMNSTKFGKEMGLKYNKKRITKGVHYEGIDLKRDEKEYGISVVY